LVSTPPLCGSQRQDASFSATTPTLLWPRLDASPCRRGALLTFRFCRRADATMEVRRVPRSTVVVPAVLLRRASKIDRRRASPISSKASCA
jgi:hypothetical protein